MRTVTYSCFVQKANALHSKLAILSTQSTRHKCISSLRDCKENDKCFRLCKKTISQNSARPYHLAEFHNHRHRLNPAHRNRSTTITILCIAVFCIISTVIKLVAFASKRLHSNNRLVDSQYRDIIAEESYHVISIIAASTNFFICFICSRQFRYSIAC